MRELDNCGLGSDFRVPRHAEIYQFDHVSLEINFKRARSCNYGIPRLVQVKMKILYSQRVSKYLLALRTISWSLHLNEHEPSWSFKQRQLNQAITITLGLTEHVNIFLNTYSVVVFSYLYLQPLFPCTRRQQCFTTATILSFGHFEHLELPLSLYCDVAFTRCE